MTAMKRCGTPLPVQPIRRQSRCHAPARHASGSPTSLVSDHSICRWDSTIPGGPYHAADSHTKHDYKASTTRTLNIAPLTDTHPRCSFQLLLATSLTRFVSPIGTPACSPDRRLAKRARTHRRPSNAAAACPRTASTRQQLSLIHRCQISRIRQLCCCL